jgi:DNA-binding NarL/FixJ family response regulator
MPWKSPHPVAVADEVAGNLHGSPPAGAAAPPPRQQIEELERQAVLAEFKPRELDVLQLLAQGLDTASIAQRLGIAPHTVEWHIGHVMEKLHVQSSCQAVIEAAHKGLIQL